MLEYEAEGYELHCVTIDSIGNLPTNSKTLAEGAGSMQLMYEKIRNFFSKRDTLCLSTHQLSPEALVMSRSGLKGFEFLDQLSEGAYYKTSKAISHVVDGDIYLKISLTNKKPYLYIRKDKHRDVDEIEDKVRKVMLPFPSTGPIPDDTGLEIMNNNNIKEEDEFIL
jgi:hypothetical protein